MPKPPSVNPAEEARELLAKLGFKSPPTPIEKIARALDAQVRFAPLDDELSGMIYIKDGVPIIGVNALHHPNRQRFTLSHEIGHLVMHRNVISEIVHVDKDFIGLMRDSTSATGTERREIQANEFAAELLMPRTLIEQALEGIRFDIEDEGPLEALAKKFKVSKQALEYRIRNRS